MDYTLAALKLVCAQLKHARQTPSQNAWTLGGILFQRAWLQGILVSVSNDGTQLLLDDGTGIVELCIDNAREFRNRKWVVGSYVMVVGGYVLLSDEQLPIIKVHKIVDLSPFPDREALWYLEVIESYKMFYETIIEELT